MRPPHIDWPRRILCVILSGPAAAILTGVLLGFAEPDQIEQADPPDDPCWTHELDQTVADIDPDMPIQVAALGDAWGRTNIDEGYVLIDPNVPCDQIRGVVAHEWGHYQQHEIYGSKDAAVDVLDSIEFNADCVAEQLDPGGDRAYLDDRECTPQQQRDAERTIHGKPVRDHDSATTSAHP